MMKRDRVVVKRVVSADGKIVAEAKSVAKASDADDSQINQSVSVNISSDNNSCTQAKSNVRSSSTSYSSISIIKS
ncbi:MAG TPA: hypothetical protein V6C71_00860 [Coleofasciculaceae cyanobacterium]|jgi:hypothetical protein